MSDLVTINNKISFIKKYLLEASKMSVFSREELENDTIKRAALERFLFLIVQATIDMSEAFLAYKSVRMPTTYSENFDILFDLGVIDQSLREPLIKMTGFRNILAHGYDKVQFETLFSVLTERLKDIEKLIERVEAAL